MEFRIEKPSSIALPPVGVSSLRWLVGEKVCVSVGLRVRVSILLQQRAGIRDGELVSDDEYPMSILIAVVLPAPFGPSIPKHSPRLMPIVNPRTEFCVRVRVRVRVRRLT